jgi:hypothetical protein
LNGRFSDYDQCVGNLLAEVAEKQARLDDVLAQVDMHSMRLAKFLQTHDIDLVR